MVVVQPGIFAGGEMADLMRAHDWGATPLGPAGDWPPSLLTALNLILESRYPMLILWGPEFIQFYNDAFQPFVGSSGSPEALGAPGAPALAGVWATIGPLLHGVGETGQAIRADDCRLVIERDGRLDATRVTFSASPIRDEAGGVGGVLVTCVDAAEQVAGDRRTIDAELRLRAALLDQAEDAIFAWTAEGAIVYWNKGAERLYGYAADEAIGRISHELLATEHPGGRDAFLQALQTDETIEGELTQTRRDGTRVTVATRHQPIREGGRLLVLEANRDISQRKASEAALRASDERQAFLLKLSDALRPLADPAGIQAEANRLVGERLHADRAYYVEIANASGLAIVGRDYLRGDVPSLAGSHPLASFTVVLNPMRNGQPFVAADATTDPRISDADRVACAARALRSFVAVPLIKAGQLVAALCVTSARSRAWTAGDVALLQEVADRTWEAVERARAGKALRESEARLSQELADTRQLQAISSHLIQEDDIDLLYVQLVDAATALMRSDMGSMQMFDPERNELVLLAHKDFAPESAAFWRRVCVDSPTSCGAALAAGERVVVPDVEACAFMAGTDDLHFYRTSAIRAMQSTPLVARDGRVVGMISTHWREVHEPTERALRLLDVLARQAADMIERSHAEKALRESERQLQQLADAMPQIVWIGSADGATITYLNRQWFDYTGQPSDGAGGRSSADVAVAIHPEDRPRTMERWSAALAAGTEFEAEARLRGADGRYRWVLSRCVPIRDDAARITQWFGTSTDITALKRAEDDLRQSEQRLQTAISIDTVGVLFFNLDGRITEANAAFERMSGYRRDELRALEDWSVLTAPERLDVTERAAAELATRGETAPYEKQMVRADGSRWWALCAPTRVAGSGRDSQCVEFILDTSDAKQLEATHAAVLDAVAHDVKNPLTTIVGQAQLIERTLERGPVDAERLRRRAAVIASGARRAADLLDDLTDSARLDSGQALSLQRAPVDLVALVESEATLQQNATDRHTIQVETTVASLVGDWDAARIRRVLDNLLGNAVKYSPNGGPVTVSLGREAAPDGGWAVVTVADRGVGIPRRDLPHVFERFHRGGNVARRIAGSGIGLSGARRIVEQHGGTIAVTSLEGQGSVFTVRLPLPADTG